MADELLGTWVFNKTINIPDTFTTPIVFSFTSYSATSSKNYGAVELDGPGQIFTYYTASNPGRPSLSYEVYSRGRWTNEGYRVITITDVSSMSRRDDFLSWLKENAVKQVQSYTIRFLNWDNTVLQTSQVEEGNVPQYTGATPTRDGYTFTGWNPEITEATRDQDYTAQYSQNIYQIRFLNWDKSILQVSNYGYGTTPKYTGATPTRDGYTFIGWQPEIVTVTGNADYVAQFTRIVPTYQIRFLDWDSSVLQTMMVEEFETPKYTGQTPTRTGYTFTGWSPEITEATRNQDYTAQYQRNSYLVRFLNWDRSVLQSSYYYYEDVPTYTGATPTRTGYTFTGWNPTISAITADTDFVAQFSQNKYIVRFLDWNGDVLQTSSYNYGDVPSYTGEQPTREGYDFVGWNPSISSVTKNQDYTAHYTQKTYTIRFLNWDGTTLQSSSVAYGITPKYNGAEPERDGYTFIGWQPTIVPATANADYTAQFVRIVPTYTIRFLDWDNSVLQSETLEQFTMPEYKGEPPTRTGYTFTGWKPEITEATRNQDYIAQYSQNIYQIRFLNWDSSVLQTMMVEEFETPKYTGQTPTRTGYTFTGWSPEITEATRNQDYTAQYQRNSYLVRFLNWDRSVLQSSYYYYEDVPTYTGATPTRTGYTFTGWNPTISAITADTDFVAQFSQNKYIVRFLDWNGDVLQTSSYNYGDVPSYTGEQPTREGYDFVGWNPSISSVTKNQDYTAHYTQKTYTIRFLNWDGTTLQSSSVAYGITPKYNGAEPERDGYTFIGWQPTIVPATANADYTAQFVRIVPTYTIRFLDWDNSVLQSETLEQFTMPEYKGEPPTRTGYTFTGWKPEITEATRNQDYIAQYSQNIYQIRFLNWDRSILQVSNYGYGTTPEYTGSTPERAGYTFTGWSPTISTVVGNQDYIAQFAQNLYIIRFIDWNGTILQTSSYKYREMPSYKEGTPTREGYTFIGWNPSIVPAISNQDYTATYVASDKISMFLYQCTAENERVNKSEYLTEVGQLYGYFRDETNLLSPNIIIEYDKIPDFNYVYLSSFGRYYYVKSYSSVRTNYWRINLSIDVLMTYKDFILNLEPYVARNENQYDDSIEDTLLPLEYSKTVEETSIESTGENVYSLDDYSIFITTLFDDSGENENYVEYDNEPIENKTGSNLLKDSIYPYEGGSTKFSLVQMISASADYQEILGKIIAPLINDDTLASYVVSMRVLPVSNVFAVGSDTFQSSRYLYIKNNSSKIDVEKTQIIHWHNSLIPPMCVAKFTITGKYGNFLDYEPYTTYEIYLPFYGWATLPSYQIVGKEIRVVYIMQATSSDGYIYVLTNSEIVFGTSAKIGVDIAVNTTNAERINREGLSTGLNSAISGIGGVALMTAGLMTGNPFAIVGGFSMSSGAITSGISGLMKMMPTASANVSNGYPASWTSRQVRLRVTYPTIATNDVDKYAKYIGRPLQKSVKLSTLTGMTVVGGVHIEGLSTATNDEKAEIDRLLRKGVVL